MLGHFRHEVGHYYEWILVEQTGWIDECRTIFGDERASYRDAIARHYKTGAPRDWAESFISEYATMHPWEDFAECFAHYLHLTSTLQTAAGGEMSIRVEGVPQIADGEVTPAAQLRRRDDGRDPRRLAPGLDVPQPRQPRDGQERPVPVHDR